MSKEESGYALMLQTVVDSFEEEKKKFPFLEGLKEQALQAEMVSKYKGKLVEADRKYHIINFLEVIEKWPKPRQLTLFTKFVSDLKNVLLNFSGQTPALPPSSDEEK